MNTQSTTLEYYRRWLGIAPEEMRTGIRFAYNPDRNIIQQGYTRAVAIYAYCARDTIIISYGDEYQREIAAVQRQIAPGMTAADVKRILSEATGQSASHNIKYVFASRIAPIHPVVMLHAGDYPLYLDFFKAVNPNCTDTSWVHEYFSEMAAKGRCHGIIADGLLASATDTPDMPYMSDEICEIGINTRPEYRGRHYAQSVCASLAGQLIDQGVCPIWSTSIDNIASQKLAASVGFDKLADVIRILGASD